MDARSEIREFLNSRRAKITPEQAGLRTYGGQRRVPGLRRRPAPQRVRPSVQRFHDTGSKRFHHSVVEPARVTDG